MVEHNVIFNEDNVLTKSDHITIPRDVLSERERDKIIQHPENNNNPDEGEPQNAPNEINPPVDSVPLPLPNTTQSDLSRNSDPEPDEVEPLNIGWSTQGRHAPGHYKWLHEGKSSSNMSVAAVMETNDDDDDNMFAPLPADFALARTMGNEQKMLDKVLRGPHAK
jgi:hypothetical protein